MRFLQPASFERHVIVTPRPSEVSVWRVSRPCKRWTTLAVAMVFAGCSQRHATTPNPILEAQSSGTTALLQAVSVVDENIVWVSGHRATYARTVDGGATWEAGVVPGPDSLQFRDVHAVDAKTAYLLSAGPGDMSRIYKLPTQDSTGPSNSATRTPGRSSIVWISGMPNPAWPSAMQSTGT